MFICTEKERKGEDTKKQQWVRKRRERDLKVKEEEERENDINRGSRYRNIIKVIFLYPLILVIPLEAQIS